MKKRDQRFPHRKYKDDLIPGPKPHKAPRPVWETKLSVLFDAEMAERFALIRMRMQLGQDEIADILGVSQQTISRLERGHLRQPEFSLALMRAVFGEHVEFILFGGKVEQNALMATKSAYHFSRYQKQREKQKKSHNDGSK